MEKDEFKLTVKIERKEPAKSKEFIIPGLLEDDAAKIFSLCKKKAVEYHKTIPIRILDQRS